MNQRIYKTNADVLRYQWVVLPGDGRNDSEVFSQFSGMAWTVPPRVTRVIRSPDEPVLPLGDFPNIYPNILVISEKAHDCLEAMFAESGQSIRVSFESTSVFLFNAFTMQSINSSSMMRQALTGGGLPALFRPSDRPSHRPFVTDKFVTAYARYNLCGLLFTEVT